MKIAVDPGHGMSNSRNGMYDPGATYVDPAARYEEADLTLRYGLALRDVLRSANHEVFMTRDDAQDHAPVIERARNAARAGASVLVSLHMNSAEDHRASGVEVMYGNPASIALATRVQRALVASSGLRDRGIKLRTDLAVLKFKGPAVLIELGFIGNDGDRKALLDVSRRERIVQAIAGALDPTAAPGVTAKAARAPKKASTTKAAKRRTRKRARTAV